MNSIATFEGDASDSSSHYLGSAAVVSFTAANHTPGGIKVAGLNKIYPVGPSKSIAVFPGDKVDLDVYAYYQSTSGWTSSNEHLL